METVISNMLQGYGFGSADSPPESLRYADEKVPRPRREEPRQFPPAQTIHPAGLSKVLRGVDGDLGDTDEHGQKPGRPALGGAGTHR
jgi:hypothetical protein